MAEDKRIRIGVDYSELDHLREKIRSLTFELNRVGDNFSGISPDKFQGLTNQFVDLQQRALNVMSSSDNQFRVLDRAWDRFSGGYISVNPDWRSRLTNLGQSQVTPDRLADVNSNNGLWGRISGFLSRIASSLEKENRDRDNGEVPLAQSVSQTTTQPEQQASQSQATGVEVSEMMRNFRLPTSMGSLLGMFAGGAILAQLGQMIGQQFQFSAQQYSLGDDFMRNINVGNNPLLNAMTFGITGASASRRMHAYQMARQFDSSAIGYSQLTGSSYDEGLGALYRLGGNLSDGKSLQRELWGEFGSTFEDRLNEASGNGGTGQKALAFAAGGGSTIGGTSLMTTNYIDTGRFGGSEEVGRFGLQNWASRNLGIDVSEYLSKYVQFARAGLTSENTSREASLNQLMLAQRYRGLSDSDIENIQRATRYSENRTGAQALSAIDAQLRNYSRGTLGYSDQRDISRYVSTMLPEAIQRFSDVSNSVLSVRGSFDAADVLRQMSSIQNATGAQGQQLSRYQDALMGRGVSQDDVTQALLLRTARQLRPDGSYTDLMADVEAFRAGGKSDVAKKFYDQIVKITGGKGEQFRTILKSVYGDRLSWNDVIELEKGGKTPDEIFGGGISSGSAYTEEQASRTLSASEISAAETRNRQGFEGHEDVYSQLGMNLTDAINNSQVSKDINEIASGFKDVLLEYVAKKMEESNRRSVSGGSYSVEIYGE